MDKNAKISIAIGVIIALIIFSFILYFQFVSASHTSEAGLILFWDNSTSIPSGWTCISCASGDDFFERFPYGNSSYGDQGGADTHNHTSSGTSGGGSSTINTDGQPGPPFASGSGGAHTHTITANTSESSNLPPFRTLRMIRYDAGIPPTLPIGAIAIFNGTTLPTNWTRLTEFDGDFILANNTVNSTGGDSSHNHTFSGETSIASNVVTLTESTVRNISSQHAHTITEQNLSEVNHEPPYITIILAQINSSDEIPIDMIGMFNATPSGGWKVLSDSGGDFNERFLLANSTYNATGGTSNHTHANLTDIVTGGPSSTNLIPGGGFPHASNTHTNTFTQISFSNVSHLPSYTTVIFAQALDLIHPSISITSPSNLSNFTSATGIEINYSVSDNLGLSSCWWTNNTGVSNTTITCGVNVTGQTWDEGLNNVTVYANDTSNNINFSSISFRVNSIPPALVIDYPTEALNLSFNNTINLNYTVSSPGGDLDSCWFNIDRGSNTTIANCLNTTFNTSDGDLTLYLFANDTGGNENSTNVSFTVDTIFPDVDVRNIETTTGSQTITFDNIASDTNLNTCKWSIFNSTGGIDGLNENTSIACIASITSATASTFGTFNLTVYAIDYSGNENSSTQNFTTRATAPPGGGGGAAGIITPGFLQSILATNFSIASSSLTSFLDFVLAKDSVRPREKEFLLLNRAKEPVTLELICDTAGLNETEENKEDIDICDYVFFESNQITVSPNEIEPSIGKILVFTPQNASFGDRYLFNILAINNIGNRTELFAKLSIQNRVPFWAVVFKWSPWFGQQEKPLGEKAAYPVFWVSLGIAVVVFTGIILSFTILRKRKKRFPITSLLGGIVPFFTVFILLLFLL